MTTILLGASFWIPSARRWFGTDKKAGYRAHHLNDKRGLLHISYHHHGHLSLRFSPRETSSSVSAAQKKESPVEFSADDAEADDEEMPFAEMKKWMASKPSGFGHGKTYDTSIEDSIAAEIEQSRKAHIANVNSMKRRTEGKAGNAKHEKQQKPRTQENVLESVPSGVHVRVGNLPKKKNIVRDLQAAFKGFPGLLHIQPVVSGNEKTRDPICKGMAFLIFGSEDLANRFATKYNGENILFGKIEKRITCCLASPSSLINSNFMSTVAASMCKVPRLRIREKESHLVEYINSVDFQQEKEKILKSSMASGGMDDFNCARENVWKENSEEKMASCLAKHNCSSSNRNEDQGPPDARPAMTEPKTNLHIASSSDRACGMIAGSEFYQQIATNKNSNQDHIIYAQEASNSAACSDADISRMPGQKKNFPSGETKDNHILGSFFSENLNKNEHHSEGCSKASEGAWDLELGNVGVFESRSGGKQAQHLGASTVKILGGQALVLEAETKSGKEDSTLTLPASKVNEESQKIWKGKKNQKDKKQTEAKSSKQTSGVLGSAYRLKKKERSVLTNVLAKYGGDHAVINAH